MPKKNNNDVSQMEAAIDYTQAAKDQAPKDNKYLKFLSVELDNLLRLHYQLSRNDRPLKNK
jgi:hypothetical protein